MKSDLQLEREIFNEIAQDPGIYSKRLTVTVTDRTALLSGRVRDFWEKWHAERAARRVEGVKAVQTNLIVTLATPRGIVNLPARETPAQIAQHQRDAAESISRLLGFICGEAPQELRFEPSVAAIRHTIEDALAHRALARARQIKVDVDGGEVTLTGRVQSWADREAAKNSVWKIPGVRQVHDGMTLTG